MSSTRQNKALLAIHAIIRGLESDQLEFHYDESAWTFRPGDQPGSESAEPPSAPVRPPTSSERG